MQRYTVKVGAVLYYITAPTARKACEVAAQRAGKPVHFAIVESYGALALHMPPAKPKHVRSPAYVAGYFATIARLAVASLIAATACPDPTQAERTMRNAYRRLHRSVRIVARLGPEYRQHAERLLMFGR